MTQMEKKSTYNVTTSGVYSTPSLNPLPSSSPSQSHLNPDNLQTYDGEITHDQDPVSNGESSIAIEEETLLPKLSQDSFSTIQEDTVSPDLLHDSSLVDILLPRVVRQHSDRPYTHILLQKNEKPEELSSVLDSAVSGCICRSEKASQNNYKVQIKSEPTTIVITRRGSTNSITAVGSCARFRAGGNDKERSHTGRKSKKKARKRGSSLWGGKDSDRPLSSTSAESARSSGSDTKRSSSRSPRKTSYFKRLSSRRSEGSDKRKPRARHPSSSPKHDLGPEELRARISEAFIHHDRRFLGPGDKDEEENINKSEGPNKRESRSKSAVSKSKMRKTRSKSPKPKQSSRASRRTQQDTISEPLYVKETASSQAAARSFARRSSPVQSYSKQSHYGPSVQDKGVQTDGFRSTFESALDNKPCCPCKLSTTHPGRSHPCKLVWRVRSDVRSTVEYDLDRSEMLGSETQPQYSREESTWKRAEQPSTLDSISEQPVRDDSTRESTEIEQDSEPKSTTYQYEDQPPRQTRSSERQTREETRWTQAEQEPESAPKSTIYRSTQTSPSRSATDHSPSAFAPDERRTTTQMQPEEAQSMYVPPEQSTYTSESLADDSRSPTATSQYRSIHGSGQEYRIIDNAARPEEGRSTTHHPESRRETGATIYCNHCGCGLETVPSSLFKERSRGAPPSQDSDVSHVLWALAKVTIFKDGTRNFEILESTSIPPGHYLMPGNDEYVLVPMKR